MLLTKDLIEGVEEKYVPMLKTVDIPNFTKCVAIFSGIRLQNVSDKAIKEMLVTWAEHKYHFYELFGNRTQIDIPVQYKAMNDDVHMKWDALKKKYPAFLPWFRMFRNIRSNKLDERDFYYADRDMISEVVGTNSFSGVSLTHFFKSKLIAPDDLVTAIAAIYENTTIEATFTMSIDPTDMMTASENPYKWNSCYRLETDCSESHADGCMAAVLDKTSTITYVWKEAGKLDLYHEYELKDLRYKMMRMWVAMSPNYTTLHFNSLYPQKDAYPEEFRKMLREKVEGYVANKLNITNKWVQANSRPEYNRVDCDRHEYYGYDEFSSWNMWTQADSKPEDIIVYDTYLPCACGCGNNLLSYSEDGGTRYRGEGFNCEGYEEAYWCEYADDYCSHECEDHMCEGCCYWEEAHPYCEQFDIECPDVPQAHWDCYGGRSVDPEDHKAHCAKCPHMCNYKEEQRAEQRKQITNKINKAQLKGRQFKLGTTSTNKFKLEV